MQAEHTDTWRWSHLRLNTGVLCTHVCVRGACASAILFTALTLRPAKLQSARRRLLKDDKNNQNVMLLSSEGAVCFLFFIALLKPHSMGENIAFDFAIPQRKHCTCACFYELPGAWESAAPCTRQNHGQGLQSGGGGTAEERSRSRESSLAWREGGLRKKGMAGRETVE